MSAAWWQCNAPYTGTLALRATFNETPPLNSLPTNPFQTPSQCSFCWAFAYESCLLRKISDAATCVHICGIESVGGSTLTIFSPMESNNTILVSPHLVHTRQPSILGAKNV